MPLSIGYDIGSSSIKCSILDPERGSVLSSGSSPQTEMEIQSPHPGWAEQDPEEWWGHVKVATRQALQAGSIDPKSIRSIGISYQMHGLVLVDSRATVVRPSIIWCDSRAVDIGKKAFENLGAKFCLTHLLNSPGNFTASKLRWVKENEPAVYGKVHKAMLPGDFIACKLTGEISSTVSGMSEGIFWDFARNAVSKELLEFYGIEREILPDLHPTFSIQGTITTAAAKELGFNEKAVVSYRAGDQPNNAFSLNVLQPGEVAATAGTSGVVYGVIDQIRSDPLSRVNQFAHVNHTKDQTRLGVLLCINGTGILNSWLRKTVGGTLSYDLMNRQAKETLPGSDGLSILPFGNGAERVLENRTVGGRIIGLDFNRHKSAHVFRAAQEGIAFSLKYGIDVMNEMGLRTEVIRAGESNMFLSPLFREVLATITGAVIELYETDGAQGAARGAAVGSGACGLSDAFRSLKAIAIVRPDQKVAIAYKEAYELWLSRLNASIHER